MTFRLELGSAQKSLVAPAGLQVSQCVVNQSVIDRFTRERALEQYLDLVAHGTNPR
jgi:hypothetical protein